jgi:hypothetical protein
VSTITGFQEGAPTTPCTPPLASYTTDPQKEAKARQRRHYEFIYFYSALSALSPLAYQHLDADATPPCLSIQGGGHPRLERNCCRSMNQDRPFGTAMGRAVQQY